MFQRLGSAGTTLPGCKAISLTRRNALTLAAGAAVAGSSGLAAAAPQGQLTWGHSGLITPFIILYALQNAMLKPMPGKAFAPSLAESWTASEDSSWYKKFVLRKGPTFHNGDPVTAEDVKFSFMRYRGASRDVMASRVASIETPDPQRVRFHLKEPWPALRAARKPI